jgi:hypothetical protein
MWRARLAAALLLASSGSAEPEYITLELSKNLVIIDGDAQWVPVVRVYYRDAEVLVSVTQDGPVGRVDDGKVEQLQAESAARILQASGKLIDELRRLPRPSAKIVKE